MEICFSMHPPPHPPAPPSLMVANNLENVLSLFCLKENEFSSNFQCNDLKFLRVRAYMAVKFKTAHLATR